MKAYVPLITVSSYLQMVESGQIEIAPFQRGIVWTLDKMSSYINALIDGYGTLSTIVIGEVGGKKMLIDGLNRTVSMVKFKNNEIVIRRNKKYVKFSELSPREQTSFLNAQLLVVFVTVDNVAELFEIFKIVNSQSRMRVADLFAGMRILDEKIKLIYSLAEKLKDKLCRVEEKSGRLVCRRHPMRVATAMVYWILNRDPVPSYVALEKAIKAVPYWSIEQVKGAVEKAEQYIDSMKLMAIDDLAKELAGTAVRYRRSWMSIIEEHKDKYKWEDLVLLASVAGCYSAMCTITTSRINRIIEFIKEQYGVEITRNMLLSKLKKLVSSGICEKKRNSYICNKQAILDVISIPPIEEE